MNEITIECNEVGTRLDKFLSMYLENFSRSQIQNLISSNQVFYNSICVNNSSCKTKLGTYLINLSSIKQRPDHLEPYNFPLNIVFEDEYLLVINKPAGLTVHPGAGNYNQTLANALIFYTKNNLSKIGGEFRPGIVHRLDKDTSGLIIVAKDDHTHQLLSGLLAEKEIKRYYVALAYGCPELKAGTIKTFLAKDFYDHTKVVVTKKQGREAITHYVLLDNFKNNMFSLIECRLETGRTHQIRVHLNYKGFPIVGDPVYNSAQNKYHARLSPEVKEAVSAFPRQALHAYKLEFIHPITAEDLSFTIELPEDFEQLCQELKRI